MKNKKFCVLQVTAHTPNLEHAGYFSNKENSDFYFVTYERPNENALKFCPDTVWSETRNTLSELVPKKYDYYAFFEYDIGLDPQFDLGPYEQILEDLELNPAVLTYYPGRGIHNPIAQDHVYLKSRDYSCIPFTHNGIKIVHKSLLNWFFPMYTKFRTDTDGCHMFNIQEIPFLRDIVCSHKMVHHNNETSKEKLYNKNGAFTKMKMDEMWKEILPAFKKRNLLGIDKIHSNKNYDSMQIKHFLVDLFKKQDYPIRKNSNNVDFYDLERISKFFDPEHTWIKMHLRESG